jgi:hypothetical protein
MIARKMPIRTAMIKNKFMVNPEKLFNWAAIVRLLPSIGLVFLLIALPPINKACQALLQAIYQN